MYVYWIYLHMCVCVCVCVWYCGCRGTLWLWFRDNYMRFLVVGLLITFSAHLVFERSTDGG